MSINVNVGNNIPTNVVEVGNEISVNQLAAITAATGPSATNPFSTASHTHVIANVTGLQTTLDAIATGKAPTVHTHAIADITGLSNELASKAGISHNHIIEEVNFLPEALADKAPLVHTHVIADTTGLQTALDGKSATTHLHTGVYSPVAHTHAIADTTGLQTALDGKASTTHTHTGVYAPVAHTHTGVYAPVAHTHNLTDIIALDVALANKSDIGHGHINYALLSGATFTGTIYTPEIRNPLNTDLIIDSYNDTGAGTHYEHKFTPFDGKFVLATNGGGLTFPDGTTQTTAATGSNPTTPVTYKQGPYTITNADENGMIVCESGCPYIELPNPSGGFTVGKQVLIVNSSGSTVYIANGQGANYFSAGNKNIIEAYGCCAAVKTHSNSWLISGNLI